MWTELIGWIAVALALIVGIPQFIRLMRTRNADGISLVYWRLYLGIPAAWVAHGIIMGTPQTWACNGGVLVMNCAIVFMIHQVRKIPLWKLVLPGLVILAVLLPTDLLFGSAVFGVPIALLQLLGNMHQSLMLVRSASVAGVSVGFAVIMLLSQIAWCSWALSVPDPGMAMASGTTGLVNAFNLVWLLHRRRN
ncbi:MAG: hypothetical protein LBR20_07095 [Propionibacteriaceae bacterium]|jgi:uncharacterized protein with PQ loop repeat|nr:hypothetical protein [Propionibacteriaceae bacterium]